MRTVVFTLLVLFLVPVISPAQTTWYVPDHYSSIQAAISGAANGDTVIVRSGFYVENINFQKRAITVKSEFGPELTVIDGNQSASVVTFSSKEDRTSVLEGFTITNGNSWVGGGIYCYSSSPSIINNIIKMNSSTGLGGGMDNSSSSPLVKGCVFWSNTAPHGGGMANGLSTPLVENCTFIGNSATEGAGVYNSVCSKQMIIRNCVFTRNFAMDGGGVFNYASSPVVSNCTFWGNMGGLGGGISDYPYLTSSPTIRNNIFWGNKNGELFTMGSVTYCCIQGGHLGSGNIQSNPLFTAGPKGFLYLSQVAAGQPVDSPCVDSGGDLASNLGMDVLWTRTDGVFDSRTVDMGFHYGDFPYPSLHSDSLTLSAGVGNSIDFLLLANKINANRNYLIFGGVSGTSPGNPLPGGFVSLPINWDIFTNFALGYVNTSIFKNFMGTLNQSGEATAIFDPMGPFSGGIGLWIYFSYALNNPWNYVSNPVRIQVVP